MYILIHVIQKSVLPASTLLQWTRESGTLTVRVLANNSSKCMSIVHM